MVPKTWQSPARIFTLVARSDARLNVGLWPKAADLCVAASRQLSLMYTGHPINSRHGSPWPPAVHPWGAPRLAVPSNARFEAIAAQLAHPSPASLSVFGVSASSNP